ncbi:aminoacyl-tRNA deacylase [Ferrimonas aestuarii]|nr:YbaK/EbsC family protein [Ferrimonas aestuarii]
MAIAISVNDYLISHQIPFKLVSHPYSETAVQSAISAGIPQRQVAKAVLLEDHQGQRLLAILPADRRLRLNLLGQMLDRSLSVVPEVKAAQRFPDCQFGAVPALGQAYHLMMVVDDTLLEQSQVFFEAGDHQQLVKVMQRDFGKLMLDHRHGQFSIQPEVDYGQRRIN